MLRWLKEIPLVWPVVVTAIGVLVTAASANTRFQEIAQKTDYMWAQGSPPVMVRLAQIDDRQAQELETLQRIDHKLDKMDDRVRTDDVDARGRN